MNALAQKLQIKPGKNWLLYNAPASYTESLEPLPNDVQLSNDASGMFHGIQFFIQSKAELKDALELLANKIAAETIVWLCYPKKSSGMVTDLSMMGNWDELDSFKLEVVASVSINEVWSGLRLRPVGLAKTTGVANEEIKTNEYAAYVDVVNKQVKLPPDIETALGTTPAAMAYFQTLAYSHKKEYVMWILTAKQQKTRMARVLKMVEMLLAKKKNPAEK